MATPTAADLAAQVKALADNNGNLLCMQGDKAVMLPVAALLQSLQNSGQGDMGKLALPDALNLIGQVNSFDDLRKLKPSVDGMRVSLRGWNAGTRYGGGEFIASLNKKAADDGGMTASSGQNWYWVRVMEDITKLNITHFGAIPDGKTDCATAVAAMHNWQLKNCPELGVKFTGGKYYLSRFAPAEVNLLRLAGEMVNFGYFPATTIYSDNKSEFMLEVKARKTEISNIIFNGRTNSLTVDDGKGNQVPNTKGFYHNSTIEGQFVRVDCVKFQDVGGDCMSMIDTLDTKISQWYASGCTGDIIKATWSNSPKGNWDHSTAIELTNFNVQKSTKGMVFNLPRCAQSFISNGWIEHSENPGTIDNGQWVITGLSMETCTNPLQAGYSRIIELQRNLQAGASIDYTAPAGLKEWLSEWERGRVDIQNHGIFVDGTLDVRAYASRCKLNNNSAKTQWFCVGDFYSPAQGDSIEINMIGCGNTLTITETLDKLDDVRQGGGNTLIRAHLTKGGVQCSHQPEGSSPLTDVRYVQTGGGKMRLYVQLKPYTYNIIPMVTFTGKTHFEAGVSLYWRPDLSAISDADFANISGMLASRENWSIGQKAGVGCSDDGYLLLKSKVVNGALQVKIENKIFAIGLTEVKQ